MTLRSPELAALAPLLALVFTLSLWARWRRLQRLARAFEAPALGRLLPSDVARFPRTRLWALILAGSAVGLAASEARWVAGGDGEVPPPLDLALVVDISLSMGATDVSPNRIGRAREVVARLTEELPSARFSLVTFAAWPYTLVPPTDDASIVRYFADSLSVDLVREPDRGSALSEALGVARGALDARSRENARRVVLVLSDGGVEDREDVEAVTADMATAGIETWAAAIGSEEGIALFAGSEPLLVNGVPAMATFDADLLRAVADAGGGAYELVATEPGLQALVAQLRELSGDAVAHEGRPVDATFLLVLLAVPLLLWDGAADAGREGDLVARRSRVP